MRYLLLMSILLIGCTKQESEDDITKKYWRERNIRGVEFSKTIWNRCFESWAGYVYLLEKNDGSFLVDDEFPSTQFCVLNKQCSFSNKNKCLIAKNCDNYVQAGFVENKMKELRLKPINCPQEIK